MDTKLKVKVIMGSIRPTRFSEKVAPWVLEQIAKHTEFDADLIDLRDYEMPFFNEPVSPGSKTEPYKNEAVARWTQKIAEADAYIFILPEYDRSVPGVLKNALDWVYPEWNKKTMGVVAYGTLGGGRATEHLRTMAVELQMSSVRAGVHIMAPWMLLDESSNLKAGSLSEYEASAKSMLEQLSWWAKTLKAGREQTAA